MRLFALFFSCCCCSICSIAQTLKGTVTDINSGEPLYGVIVAVKGTANGTVTDFDGNFVLKVESLPALLEIKMVGYTPQDLNVTSAQQLIAVKLETGVELDQVDIVSDRILQKQKQNPLTVESMDQIAIKEAATGNFYESLGSLKGVDLTTASLGFRVINTRGFNSTSPVRSLQLIDGVDNQSPGLNFSLGNFLGASDLDVKSVDIVQGASSAFYGPGAFNGVISMETKNPFLFQGLSVQMKVGERNLVEPAVRWAQVFKNKKGEEYLAYKLNVYYMKAYDWEATNYNPIYGSDSLAKNPGRFDAVNVYGDQYSQSMDLRSAAKWDPNFKGLGLYYRPGYKEVDLVDYHTYNLKTNASVHWRIKPELQAESPELILSSGYGNGNVVYQGDNRFALRNIMFFQNRLELEKKDKYFIRLYATNENSGSSYDPYATAIKMMNDARTNGAWAQVYQKYWKDRIVPKMNALGYPTNFIANPNYDPTVPGSSPTMFNQAAYNQFLNLYGDSLAVWHSEVANWANTGTAGVPGVDSPVGFYAPGTAQFTEAFNRFKSSKNNTGEGGTLFFDRSALYHGQAERTWTKKWMDKIRVGANARLYRPYSEGTIFSDSVYYNHFTNASGFADSTRMYNRITNFQYGLYAGVEKKLLADELILSATIRMDKNENFNAIFSPAASAVYMPKRNHVFRASFSSGLRNPTLTDQYLYLNVGPAILSGNLKGVNGLYTVESFKKYIEGVTLQPSVLKTFNIAPIRPEQVRSFDFGYRGTLKERWYVDASYYFSIYNHFIGYQIGVYSKLDEFNFPTNTQAYRYSANSLNTVTTQGANVGVNYYFKKHFSLNANYSWNELVKTDKDDPIIPAFNTPKNKYNVGLTAREIHIKKTKNPIGFSVNFKWIEGFLYEGSPQFTGYVPTYNMMDAQVNYKLVKYNTTFKFGGSNVLNNMKFQTYGGPRIGRLLYFSLLYEWDPKKK